MPQIQFQARPPRGQASPLRAAAFACAAALLASPSLAASPASPSATQSATPADGYQAGFSADLSDRCATGSTIASFIDGSYLLFDGYDVEHRAATGGLLRRYVSFPLYAFPSFLVLSSDGGTAYFGESSTGGVFELDLISGQLSPMATLAFNFDMALDEQGGVGYVSAATGAFGLNSVHRIDLDTFAAAEVVTVTGFSGPLATDGGDLLLGLLPDVFPFPADSTSVLRFAAPDLAGGSLLTEADATTEIDLLDGLSSLAFDAGGSQAVFMETNTGASGFDSILWKQRVGGAREIVAEVPGFTGGVEVMDAGIGTHFGPYQPNYVSVNYIESDCFNAGTRDRVEIRGLRPQAAFEGPNQGGTGNASFDLTGGPASGSASLWIARSGALDPADTIVDLGGTYPIALRADLIDFGRRFPMLSLDPNGAVSLPFFQDVSIEGAIMGQWIVFDAVGTLVSSSNFLVNRSPF